MELEFGSLELQRLAESAARSNGLLGELVGSFFRQRLCELAAADSLAIVTRLPALLLQPVGQSGRRFSINVGPKHRLIFEVPGRKRPDVDFVAITAVRVIAVEEV